MVCLTWLAGGAGTWTGPPKPPNVRSSVSGRAGLRYLVRTVVIVSRLRPRPCWSTSTVPATVTAGDPAACAVNAYLLPVQPGPEARPTERPGHGTRPGG